MFTRVIFAINFWYFWWCDNRSRSTHVLRGPLKRQSYNIQNSECVFTLPWNDNFNKWLSVFRYLYLILSRNRIASTQLIPRALYRGVTVYLYSIWRWVFLCTANLTNNLKTKLIILHIISTDKSMLISSILHVYHNKR